MKHILFLVMVLVSPPAFAGSFWDSSPPDGDSYSNWDVSHRVCSGTGNHYLCVDEKTVDTSDYVENLRDDFGVREGFTYEDPPQAYENNPILDLHVEFYTKNPGGYSDHTELWVDVWYYSDGGWRSVEDWWNTSSSWEYLILELPENPTTEEPWTYEEIRTMYVRAMTCSNISGGSIGEDEGCRIAQTRMMIQFET